MDTISSRENTSFLPIAGVIVGIIGIAVGGIALSKASKANADIVLIHEKLSGFESVVQSATASADAAQNAARSATSFGKQLEGQINTAFGQVASELGTIKGELEKMKTAPVAPKPGAVTKGEKAPVVAGEGEYIVAKGDVSGTAIAKKNGVSIEDLKAVNPGVNWSKLAIGQKLKLPSKKK